MTPAEFNAEVEKRAAKFFAARFQLRGTRVRGNFAKGYEILPARPLTATSPPPPLKHPPYITSPLTSSGTEGTPWTYTITATNEPTSYGATPRPSGMSISGAILSWSSPVAGTYTLEMSATNADGSDTKSLKITIGPSSGGTLIVRDISLGITFTVQWNPLSGYYEQIGTSDWDFANLRAGQIQTNSEPWSAFCATLLGTYVSNSAIYPYAPYDHFEVSE